MIVLDASALVDVVLGQATRDWVLEQLAGQRLAAPSHQPAEVVSALARLVRAQQLDPPAAHQALRDAAGLTQQLVSPTVSQQVRALQMQERVRVLDALYVVVAEDLEATLLTTDRRLARTSLPVPALAPPTDLR